MTEVIQDGNGNDMTVTANPEENQKHDEIIQTGSEGSTETVENNGTKTTPTVTAQPLTDDI